MLLEHSAILLTCIKGLSVLKTNFGHFFEWPLKTGFTVLTQGVQWLSGRVLDLRPRGCGFEPHCRHCVVVLEQDTFILA